MKGELINMRKLTKNVMICAAICLLLTGCGSDVSEKAGNPQDGSSEVTSTESKKETSSKKEEKASDNEEDGKYHPGDSVPFGDFKITYKSVEKYVSKNEFIQPKDGFQYIRFHFVFKNTGDEDSYVGSFDCYADGEKCDEAYVDGTAGDFLLEEVSAGRKVSGCVTYEVPKGTKMKNVELEYENNSLWSDKKIIFLGK